MVKKPVRVYVRTRPTTKFAQDKVSIFPEEKKINIRLKSYKGDALNNRKQSYSFRFDGILHNASQDEVFTEVGSDIIKGCFDGYNGTVFCYGQTGAGKTYSMSGPPDNSSDYRRRGLIPRTIEQIFEEVHFRPEKSFQLSISFMEIYNEKLVDLLNPTNTSSTSSGRDGLQIVETQKGDIFVRGLKRFPIKDEEDGLSLMFEGETQRAICEHVVNADSSRSHAIFTVYIESRSRVESTGQTTRSKLHLVDLAGSERIKKTKSVGRVLTEAKYINKSLSFLEQVVIALSTPGRTHIPYRQSLMTHFLKDSIGGNSNTSMIANIWCEAKHLEETIGTLKFGTRVMRVSNTAVVNVELNPTKLLSNYEKRIRELKRELAMHDQLKGITEVTYDYYTDEQRLELRKSIWKFINYGDQSTSSEDVLEDTNQEALDIQEEVFGVKNLMQVKESFLQFRLIVKNLQREVEVLKNDLKTEKEKVIAVSGGVVPSQTEVVVGNNNNNNTKKTSRGHKGGGKGTRGTSRKNLLNNNEKSNAKNMTKIIVGEENEEEGFAAGEGIPMKMEKKVDGKSKRVTTSKSSKRKEIDEEEEEEIGEEEEDDKKKQKLPAPPSKDEAYEMFKRSDGKELFEELRNNISGHKDTKKKYVACGKLMNRQKKEIDSIKEKINRKELLEQEDTLNLSTSSPLIEKEEKEEKVLDQEFLLLLEELKEKKKLYRKEYQVRKQLKDELNFLGSRINVQKKKMIVQFEKWFSSSFEKKEVEEDDEDEEEEIPNWLENEINKKKKKRTSSMGSRTTTTTNTDDLLDDGEMFEKLEEKRIKEEDPQSYTFYKAFQKSRVQKNIKKNRRRR